MLMHITYLNFYLKGSKTVGFATFFQYLFIGVFSLFIDETAIN